MTGVVWWFFQTMIVTSLLAGMVVFVSPLLRRRPAVLHLLWLIVLVSRIEVEAPDDGVPDRAEV